MTNNPTASTPWLARSRPDPRARLRLFCFPYAGGTTHIFRRWPEALPPSVEVCAAQLPGRGPRIGERPYSNLHDLAEALLPVIAERRDLPFAFFGHSMGALFAFELARLLRRSGGPSPVHLFASGRRAPQLPDTLPPTYNLPDAEFLEELRRLNGTPPEVLEHPELLELMIPHLRADFEVVQTYVYAEGPPLDIPVSVYGGLEDEEVSVEDLEGWREQTTAAFSLRMFPGDHFFIDTARPLLLGRLSEELTRFHLGGAAL